MVGLNLGRILTEPKEFPKPGLADNSHCGAQRSSRGLTRIARIRIELSDPRNPRNPRLDLFAEPLEPVAQCVALTSKYCKGFTGWSLMRTS